jgi:hypothetical protein
MHHGLITNRSLGSKNQQNQLIAPTNSSRYGAEYSKAVQWKEPLCNPLKLSTLRYGYAWRWGCAVDRLQFGHAVPYRVSKVFEIWQRMCCLFLFISVTYCSYLMCHLFSVFKHLDSLRWTWQHRKALNTTGTICLVPPPSNNWGLRVKVIPSSLLFLRR